MTPTTIIAAPIGACAAIWLLWSPASPARLAAAAVAPDDKSFFAEPDRNAWPGDALSEAQYEAAVAHFKNGSGWALIGPNEWLLKGTRYRIDRAIDASVPNIHYSHGYWGGDGNWNVWTPMAVVKATVEAIAATDREAGAKP